MGSDSAGSWHDRFQQTFSNPDSARQRKRVTRDSWQQLKFERRKRAEIESSTWWRARKKARRIAVKVKPRNANDGGAAGAPNGDSQKIAMREEAIIRRTKSVLTRFGYESSTLVDLDTVLSQLRTALEQTSDRRELYWFTFVAIVGRNPLENDLRLLDSDFEVYGAEHAIASLLDANARTPDSWSLGADIRFVDDVTVDVSTTAQTEVHSGIQRVVRETVSRWMSDHEVVLVVWDTKARTFRAAKLNEQERITNYAPGTDSGKLTAPDTATAEIVVPIHTVMIVPELCANLNRSLCLDALAGWTETRLSAVFYDFIGQTMPEAVDERGRVMLSNYVPVLRAADRISAISETARNEVEGFGQGTASLGLPVPSVRAHLLPAVPPASTDNAVPKLVADLVALGSGPLIVSVSRIEPRKNQITILRAAAALWAEGLEFKLLFIGWNEVNAKEFNTELERLQQEGRPVSVVSRADEDTVWGAYRTALFSVFISLAEGYGLPAAESLSVGTPVVLSNFGSMAEIGAQGGAAMVDPRNVREVIGAMRQLLTDDAKCLKLRTEALNRESGNWDDYAAETWAWLTGPEASAESH